METTGSTGGFVRVANREVVYKMKTKCNLSTNTFCGIFVTDPTAL